MKRITLSVDEESHQFARAMAAAAGVSVSALVRDCLKAIAEAETPEDRDERFRQLGEDVYASIRERESHVTAGRRREPEEAMKRDALR